MVVDAVGADGQDWPLPEGVAAEQVKPVDVMSFKRPSHFLVLPTCRPHEIHHLLLADAGHSEELESLRHRLRNVVQTCFRAGERPCLVQIRWWTCAVIVREAVRTVVVSRCGSNLVLTAGKPGVARTVGLERIIMEGFGCDPTMIVAKTRQVKSSQSSGCQSVSKHENSTTCKGPQAGRQAGDQGAAELRATR